MRSILVYFFPDAAASFYCYGCAHKDNRKPLAEVLNCACCASHPILCAECGEEIDPE